MKALFYKYGILGLKCGMIIASIPTLIVITKGLNRFDPGNQRLPGFSFVSLAAYRVPD